MHIQPLVGLAHFYGEVRRQNNDLARNAAFSDRFDQLHTAEIRHPLIDNDHIVRIGIGSESGESGIAAGNAEHFVAGFGKDKLQ